jgi:TPR repeat protein
MVRPPEGSLLLKFVRILTTSAILVILGSSPARATDVDELEHASAAAHQQQFHKSFKTLKNLACRGHCCQAQCLVGLMYERGTGVHKNTRRAVQWYRKSAQKGFADAQNRLGRMYFNGSGIAQDMALAEHWLTQAANQGVAEAQLHLGKAYLHGQGLARDEAKARRFLYLARDQGMDEARSLLNEIPGYQEVARTVQTDTRRAGADYGRGLGNIEQSWEGYGDLVKSMQGAASGSSQ